MNIFINSKDRRNGDFNSFTVDITNENSFFNLKPDEKLMVKPTSILRLNDSYNINQYNNTMVLRFYDNTNTLITTETLQIDNGYYDAFNFQETLENALTLYLNNPTGFSGEENFELSVNYNEEPSKYVITITNSLYYGAGNYITFYFPPINNQGIESLAQFMGFNTTLVDTPIISSTSQIFTSQTGVNFVFQPEVIIKCNLVRNNLETTSTTTTSSNILMTLSANTAKLQYLEFINPYDLFITECLPNFSQIEISFVDSRNRPILYLTDVLITLSFKKIRTTDNIGLILEEFEKTQKYIQLNTIGTYLQRPPQ